MGGVDAVIDHAHLHPGAGQLALQRVHTRCGEIPLRRAQGVGLATVELAHAHRIAAELAGVAADIQEEVARFRRGELQVRIQPGAAVIVERQHAALGVQQAQGGILQGSSRPVAIGQDIEHIDLAGFQRHLDPVVIARVVDRTGDRPARAHRDTRTRVGADVVFKAHTAAQAGVEAVCAHVAGQLGGSDLKVVTPIREHRHRKLGPAGQGVHGAHRHQAPLRVQQAQLGLRQRPQAVGEALHRKVIDIARRQVDRVQIRVACLVDAPLRILVGSQHTMNSIDIVRHPVGAIIRKRCAEIDHAQLVLAGLDGIERANLDPHRPVRCGRKQGAIEERWRSGLPTHLDRFGRACALRQPVELELCRRQRRMAAVADREGLDAVAVASLQRDGEAVRVTCQADAGARFRLQDRASMDEIEPRGGSGVFIRSVPLHQADPVGTGLPSAIDDACVVGAGSRRLEARHGEAILGFQSVADRQAAAQAVHHFHHRAAQRGTLGHFHPDRQHLVGLGLELEPVFVDVGRQPHRVVGAYAKGAVRPLDGALQGLIERDRGGCGLGIGVIVRGPGQQGIGTGVGLTIRRLDHQVIPTVGQGRERHRRLVAHQHVIHALEQGAVGGTDLQQRIGQGAIAAVRGLHAEDVVLAAGQLDAEPVLVVVGEQVAAEAVAGVEEDLRAEVVRHIIDRQVTLGHREAVAAHAKIVIARGFDVVRAARTRREIHARIVADAAVVVEIEQAPSTVEHTQVRVSQGAGMSRQALDAQLINPARLQRNLENITVARQADFTTLRCAQRQLGRASIQRGGEVVGRGLADAQLPGTDVVLEGALRLQEIQAVRARGEIGARIARAAEIVEAGDEVALAIPDEQQRIGQRVELRRVAEIPHQVDDIGHASGQAHLHPVAVADVGDQALQRAAGLHHPGGQHVVGEVIRQRGALENVGALAGIPRGPDVEVVPAGIGRRVHQRGIRAQAAIVVGSQQDPGGRTDRQLGVAQGATGRSAECAEVVGDAPVQPHLEPVVVGEHVDFAAQRKGVGARPVDALGGRVVAGDHVQTLLGQRPRPLVQARDLGYREVIATRLGRPENQDVVLAHRVHRQIDPGLDQAPGGIAQFQLRIHQRPATR